MADRSKATDGPTVADEEAYDYHTLPDWDNDFYNEEEILAFASALSAPDLSPSEEDLLHPEKPNTEFITALNDWRPVHQRVRGKQNIRHSRTKSRRRAKKKRDKDETREGWTYSLVKYPLLFVVLGWLLLLGVLYMLTRLYIYLYEQCVTWRGKRDRLRKVLRKQTSYDDWVKGAKELDHHLGSDRWKEDDEYAYYDSRTIRRAMEQMRNLRGQAENEMKGRSGNGGQRPIEELRRLIEACVKNNFAGFENPRLYSETYYGTKDLVQSFVEQVTASLQLLLLSDELTQAEKRSLSKHLSTNFGRTALCLSGGATFAYYHFGIAKALLDAGLLPNIITGTSGGALVAALIATRTDDELKRLLVPALAYRIRACNDSFGVWLYRWWRTGARFDSVEWAKACSWFCHGSLTFLEAYQRTGRILNVSCVPSDPHSPAILANYLTAPDCVIWSAVLASAAVPGILNPVVLMRKNRDGILEPYSFGHKWKDGSLRTDIPLKSLNLHFNVNFSIVSQVNPHINLFFFSSRGTVGRPVTHRRGRGWRGGFIGSAIEQYIKLDLTKWLKVLRHLELLPRPLGQDWSEIWLQRFSGTITIWPRTKLSDFWHILSDPSMQRLARMIHNGQLAAWPKLKFISNRMAIEKIIEEARQATRPDNQPLPTPLPDERTVRNVLSTEDLQDLLAKAKSSNGKVEVPLHVLSRSNEHSRSPNPYDEHRADSPSFSKRLSGWFGSRAGSPSPRASVEPARPTMKELRTAYSDNYHVRRSSVTLAELKRQSGVFFDDPDPDTEYSQDEFATEDEVETDDELIHSDRSDGYQDTGMSGLRVRSSARKNESDQHDNATVDKDEAAI
ncbi:patatin-domain-containing protein [Acrodontium crateriforme]|uniref:Patatin-like phospholipase domain-containing protein n=1 Tax=Acrodontium crateriforme TaxID=150365 RepID=A0AAQ3R250_9PEZI|nr:patatin-domain-containing protein [Acrodontium crateriforme]